MSLKHYTKWKNICITISFINFSREFVHIFHFSVTVTGNMSEHIRHFLVILLTVFHAGHAGKCVCHSVTSQYGSNVITSPNYPCPYPNNCQCEWRINVKRSTLTKIQISFQELEDCKDCSCDVLLMSSIRNSKPQTTRFCGNSNLKLPFEVSNTTEIRFIFKSDSSVRLRGFSLNYVITNLDKCVHKKNASGGEFSTMSYGKDNYYDNSECTWLIKAPVGKIILVTFRHFELEVSSTDCPYDSVALFNGNSTFAPSTRRKFCGNILPFRVVTNGNELFVLFKSDENINGKGFTADYEFIENRFVSYRNDPVVLTQSAGNINNVPHFARYMYDDVLTFDWLIQVDIGRIVNFQWEFRRGLNDSDLYIFDGFSDSFKILVCQEGLNRTERMIDIHSCESSTMRNSSGHVTSSLFTLKVVLKQSLVDAVNFSGCYQSISISNLTNAICEKHQDLHTFLHKTWPLYINRKFGHFIYCAFTFHAKDMDNMLVDMRKITFDGNITGGCLHGGLAFIDKHGDVTGPFCSMSSMTRLGHVRSLRSYVSNSNALTVVVYCGVGCMNISVEANIYQTDCKGINDISRVQTTPTANNPCRHFQFMSSAGERVKENIDFRESKIDDSRSISTTFSHSDYKNNSLCFKAYINWIHTYNRSFSDTDFIAASTEAVTTASPSTVETITSTQEINTCADEFGGNSDTDIAIHEFQCRPHMWQDRRHRLAIDCPWFANAFSVISQNKSLQLCPVIEICGFIPYPCAVYISPQLTNQLSWFTCELKIGIANYDRKVDCNGNYRDRRCFDEINVPQYFVAKFVGKSKFRCDDFKFTMEERVLKNDKVYTCPSKYFLNLISYISSPSKIVSNCQQVVPYQSKWEAEPNQVVSGELMSMGADDVVLRFQYRPGVKYAYLHYQKLSKKETIEPSSPNCPPSFHYRHNSCYFIGGGRHIEESYISWKEAETECKQMNSSLLTFPTKNEADILRDLLNTDWLRLFFVNIHVILFIGLKDEETVSRQ